MLILQWRQVLKNIWKQFMFLFQFICSGGFQPGEPIRPLAGMFANKTIFVKVLFANKQAVSKPSYNHFQAKIF